MADLPKVESNSSKILGEEVYKALRDAILCGDLKPNERLIETDLAKALGVSRTPVREAIHRLEADGLVHSRPNRSAVAAWFSPEDIRHIYSIRARIEGYAAKLVAEHSGPEIFDRLEGLCREFEYADPHEQDALNRKFHAAIVEGCGVRLVMQMATSLVEHTLMWRLYQLHSPEDRTRSLREHQAIVKALRLRDGDAADNLVRTHLEWARDILLTRSR